MGKLKANVILGALLLVGAAVTALYWWSYFSGGEVRLTDERWYTAFESSFPIADGWMALCMTCAGAGLILNRPWARPAGLMAGSALIYLAAMDITFNVNNGLYALASAGLAMKFEMLINAVSAALGVWSIAACWPRAGKT
ncbi:MAG: hypothetical protein R3C25_00940 [Hyphomonadaceae bacterium]